MRVLHLDAEVGWRGGQQQLFHLAMGLAGSVVAAPPGAPLLAQLRAAGGECLAHPFAGPLGGVLALRRLVARVEPDLVATHSSRAHGVCAAAGVPQVVHRRVDFPPRWTSGWKYAQPLGYVAVSRAVARVLTDAGVPDARVAVVPDGVDPLPWRSAVPRRPISGSGPWILAAGALVPHKGHAHLIDALARLPGWSLVLAGEGPLAPALRAQAVRNGVGERVHLLGWVPDLPALVAACDVFAHPSVEEGLGQVVLEALAAGARVCATRAGGVLEAVGADGVLVPPADPAALAAGVLAAARRPRVAAARWGVDEMVTATRAAYQRFRTGSDASRSAAAGE
jgi:glycosyltransferase involved in cell wall biosynthesis